MGYLDRVLQYILSIAGAVFQFPQQLYQFGMQPIDTCIKGCRLAFLADCGFHFFSCLFHHFLDTGRVYTSIYNQLFQCQSCNLSPDGIKPGENDCLRRVVNNQVNACQCFQGANVSALTTDDTSLHLIIGQLHNRNRCFCHMVNRTALNCICNNFSGAFFRLHLRLAFRFLDEQGCLVLHIIFHHCQNVILCFLGGQS